MPRTIDQRDEMTVNDTGTDPSSAGMWRYNSGNFRYQDAIGVFNPRDYWSNYLDGPSDNWAATLYKTVNYVSGTIFPASVYWYYDAARTIPAFSKTYTYSGTAYVTPTGITYKIYNSSGVLLHTCTDTITYVSGTIFESTRTRAFT